MNQKILLFSLLLFYVIFIPSQRLAAQDPAKIKLEKQYKGSLEDVLSAISFDKRVIIFYPEKKFSKTEIDVTTVGQNLNDVLDRICERIKMEWYISVDNRIMIVGLNKTPEMNASKLVYSKTFQGKATSFNILISGKVTDYTSGEAIPFASLLISNTTRGVQTNQDGYFTLYKVPTDTTTIIVSSVGYKTGYIFLTPELQKTDLIVKLEPSNIEIEQIEVTAQKSNSIQKSEKVSNIQLVPRKLTELPSLGERDIFRSLQLMPGVSAANEGSSGLYVRGGTPDQNLILYDGFTVYHVDHLYGFYSAFNTNAIKDLQLYKGGFEAKYSGRLSSVTDITGKDGNSEYIAYGGDLSLLSANLYGEFPIGKKFTSLFAFRRSYKGPLYNKIFDKFNTKTTPVAVQRPMGGPGGGFGNNYQAPVSSYFYDLNTKITYKPGKKDIISFSLYNGTDNLDNSVKLDMPDFMRDAGRGFSSDMVDLTEYGNLGSSLKWSRRWGSRFYSNTLFSYSNYFSNRDNTNTRTMTDSENNVETFKFGTLENNDLHDLSFNTNFTFEINGNIQFEFGTKLTKYDIAYNFSQNDTTVYLDISSKGNLVGGYMQTRINLFKNKLNILPGIHVTYYGITNSNFYEPRLSMLYDISDKIKLTGAWGKFNQFANRILREDILSGSRDFWILSNNENIPVGHATHYIFGASFEDQKYLFSIEGYYKNLTGLSEYTLRFNPTPRGPNQGPGGGFKYEQNFYTGVGYTKGLEFLAQKLTGKLTGWASYTLATAKNQFDVYGKEYFAASNDVTNEFKAIGFYRLKRWSFTGTWIYTTGRPYTAPEGGYNITLLDGTEKSFISAGIKNSRRLPDYHRLDLGVNFALLSNDKKTDRGSISLSLFNVYNRKNTWYKEYQIVEDQLISIDKQFLGITPNLTLTLKLD